VNDLAVSFISRSRRPNHGHAHGGGHGHGVPVSELLREGTAEGVRALRLSSLGLILTSMLQIAVAVIGGSAALLADACTTWRTC